MKRRFRSFISTRKIYVFNNNIKLPPKKMATSEQRTTSTMVIAVLQLVVYSILVVGSLVDGFSAERSAILTTKGTKKTIEADAVAVETTSTAGTSVAVQVWNDVVNDETCNALHETACQIGLGHRVFSRNMNDKDGGDGGDGPTNTIEKAIDDILSELEDTSNYVEYWTRQEWRHIEAHADIDEYSAKRQRQQESFRYPINGHVLYLRVGERVRGPTCVFPGRRSGGDLIRDLDQSSSSSSSSSSPSPSSEVELVTVPAVPGRFLRFQGDCLHAVPRPTDLWFLKFVKGSPEFEPESSWGRSVVLFNTWSEPPTEVPVSHSSTNDNLGGKMCRDAENWNKQSFVGDPENDAMETEDLISAKIWLLGDYNRRDHAMQTLKMAAPQSLRTALNETTLLRRTWLHQHV